MTPTRAWEVAHTVVEPPSSVVKCLWEVLVGGLFFAVGVCVCRCRGCCSVGVCVCDLLIFLHERPPPTPHSTTLKGGATKAIPPKHLDLFQGASLRLPKPLSDRSLCVCARVPFVLYTVCESQVARRSTPVQSTTLSSATSTGVTRGGVRINPGLSLNPT